MTSRLFVNGIDARGDSIEIAVRDGRYTEIGPRVAALRTAIPRTDLDGRLVLPGFVDGHIHLDKTFLGDRWHPHRTAATLRERLALEKQELAAVAHGRAPGFSPGASRDAQSDA